MIMKFKNGLCMTGICKSTVIHEQHVWKKYDIFSFCVWNRQKAADTSLTFRATRSGWWMNDEAFTIPNSKSFVGIFSDYDY